MILFLYFYRYFFQSAIKNLHWTVILLRVPSYYPTFSPTTIIYEHIHAIVLLSVYLQFSIHFNLWFGVIGHWRCFLLLKMSNNENKKVTKGSFLQNNLCKRWWCIDVIFSIYFLIYMHRISINRIKVLVLIFFENKDVFSCNLHPLPSYTCRIWTNMHLHKN